MGQKLDLTGQRFGKLVVIGDEGYRRKNKRGMWLMCECDCGNSLNVRKDRLACGNTTSCGCVNKINQVKNITYILTDVDRIKARKHTFVEDTSLVSIGKTKPMITNTSGHTGVSYRKDRGKWVAIIEFQKEIHRLGNFINKEDAINARKAAEDKYFKPMLDKYKDIKLDNHTKGADQLQNVY